MFNDNLGMSNIAMKINAKSRSISAENPDGKPGFGGQESGPLGKSRKGRPCINLKQGETAVIAEIEGAGAIQSFWMTVTDITKKGYYVYRDLILRIYWDDSEIPSVEVPYGDFFCNRFGRRCNVNSLPIVTNPTGGMNCYFLMPFRKKAKITIENQHPGEVNGFFYQINYCLYDSIPDEALYFHAQWRRENPCEKGKDYTLVDNIKGKGNYIGTYLAWTCLENFWWGEGEVKFYIDDDDEFPTICGTGTEDYFGGAWSYYEVQNGQIEECTYSTPFLGYPYFSEKNKSFLPPFVKDMHMMDKLYDVMPKHGLYRWHILDPIIFEKSLKVTIQQMGGDLIELLERSDDISSVSYWYQDSINQNIPKLLEQKDRRPR